jgi:mRNA interferase RelE/StbE
VILYRVTLAASVRKDLGRLPKDAVERVFEEIRQLTYDARPQGCIKLQGYKHTWRVRVGNYRIVYTVDDAAKVIDIVRVADRKDVYD